MKMVAISKILGSYTSTTRFYLVRKFATNSWKPTSSAGGTSGPDQILPATSFTTSKPGGTVKIHRSDTGPASSEPISIYSMFKNVYETFPNHTALIIKRDGKLKQWTYAQYFEDTQIAAKALIKLGLERFNGVCIMGFNSPEWFMSNFGTIFAGGLSAGVYATNSPQACRDIVNNCNAQVIVVDDNINVQKLMDIKDQIPSVKAIVQWIGQPEAKGVLSWNEFMEIGRRETDEELNRRLSLAAVNQCSSLIYTSGTTGPSKGVMLSQDHMTWAAIQFSELFDPVVGDSTGFSYLPLSHVTAHIADMYCILYNGLTVYFAQPDAMKGSLASSLIEVQPHGFIGVPRVWEKYYEKLQEIASKNGPVVSAIASWAKSHCYNFYDAMKDGRELTLFEKVNLTLAKKLIINTLKYKMGFSRMYFLASGTAPIDPEIINYFMSLDLPIQEAYGLSESLCFCSFNFAKPKQFRIGSVGRVLPQNEVMLEPTEGSKEGEGEILIKGRNIMMGYLRMPEKTMETISEDQWLCTGDLGRFDEDGFLYITGRIKEIVVTAGGENVPPVIVEKAIKNELSFINNAMLIGDGKKYLSILLTLKSETNIETLEPLQQLTPYCISWMKKIGSNVKTVAEAVSDVQKHPDGNLAKAINDGIQRYNKHHAISNAQKVQRWLILPHDFSQPTGELNGTLKLKRDFVIQKYSQQISEMYDNK